MTFVNGSDKRLVQTVEVNGVTCNVFKIRPGVYQAIASNRRTCRWGTKKEIAQDVARFQDNGGHLPFDGTTMY